MDGKGTEQEPYLIRTAHEMIDGLAVSGAYLKLMNNICVEDEIGTWSTALFNAASFDLNGFKIDKIYIQPSEMLFNSEPTRHELKNGKIFSSADANINALIANIQVDNAAIAFYGVSNSSGLLHRCTFNSCSIDVKHRTSSGPIIFNSFFDDCHIIVNAEQLRAFAEGDTSLNGCLLEGKINGRMGKLIATSSIISASGITDFYGWNDGVYSNCLNNSSLSSNPSSDRNKLFNCTQSELENPDFINENTNFWVIEE